MVQHSNQNRPVVVQRERKISGHFNRTSWSFSVNINNTWYRGQQWRSTGQSKMRLHHSKVFPSSDFDFQCFSEVAVTVCVPNISHCLKSSIMQQTTCLCWTDLIYSHRWWWPVSLHPECPTPEGELWVMQAQKFGMQKSHAKHILAVVLNFLNEQSCCYSGPESSGCSGLCKGMSTTTTFYQSSPCLSPYLHLVCICPVRFYLSEQVMRTCSFYNGRNGIPTYHCHQEWRNTKGNRTCYWLVFIDITIIHSETFCDLMVWWWRNGVMVMRGRACFLWCKCQADSIWELIHEPPTDTTLTWKKNLYSWCECVHWLTRTEKHLLHFTLVQNCGRGWRVGFIVCLMHLYQQHAERSKLSHWRLLFMFK